MRYTKAIALALMATAFTVGPLPAHAQDQPPADAKAAAPIDQAVDALRAAPDPSAAVAAYARGYAINPESTAIARAYVARMVEFGLPEMASTQAQSLVDREPNDGMAWAVLAYASARREDMNAALLQTQLAARHAPDEPFVNQTAAKIMAWYDTQAKPEELPKSARDAAQAIRAALADNNDFINAYRLAVDFYKQAAEADQPEAPAPEAEPEPRVVEETVAAPTVYYDHYTDYPTYVSPSYASPGVSFYYSNYAYRPYHWPIYSPWYCYSRPIIFFRYNFDRHHHRDHDRRHDGDRRRVGNDRWRDRDGRRFQRADSFVRAPNQLATPNSTPRVIAAPDRQRTAAARVLRTAPAPRAVTPAPISPAPRTRVGVAPTPRLGAREPAAPRVRSDPRVTPSPRVIAPPRTTPSPRASSIPRSAPAPRIVTSPSAAPSQRAAPATRIRTSPPRSAPAPRVSNSTASRGIYRAAPAPRTVDRSPSVRSSSRGGRYAGDSPSVSAAPRGQSSSGGRSRN